MQRPMSYDLQDSAGVASRPEGLGNRSDDAQAPLHVNGTDRDGQSDNCGAGDSGFQVAFL